MCQKCGERRPWRGGGGGKEQSVSLYLLADIIPSVQINSPRQGEMRYELAHERGREGRNSEMIVILICQRSIALRNLLKCPHKPKLSELDTNLATQSGTVDFLLWLTVHDMRMRP